MKTARRGQRGRGSANGKGAGTSSESSSRKSGKSKQVKISSVLTNKKQKFGKAGTRRNASTSEKQPDVIELSGDSSKDDVEVLEEETKAGAGISARTRAAVGRRSSNGSVSDSKGQARAGRKGKRKSLADDVEEKTETEMKIQPKDEDFVSHTYIVVNENAEEEEHTINELTEAEKEMILEEFDLDPTYGPCRGITRMERLQRVYRYRFLPQPPHLVAPILRKCYPAARFNTW